jgi:hypothetical protein
MHTTYNALINSLQQNAAMQNAAKTDSNIFLAMLDFVLAEPHNYTLAQQQHSEDDISLLHLYLHDDYWEV